MSFLHRYVAGIRLLDDGTSWRTVIFRIARSGGGIRWAEAQHDRSIRSDRVVVARRRRRVRAFTVTVPVGTTAEIVLPGRGPETVVAGRHAVVQGSAGDPSGAGGGLSSTDTPANRLRRRHRDGGRGPVAAKCAPVSLASTASADADADTTRAEKRNVRGDPRLDERVGIPA